MATYERPAFTNEGTFVSDGLQVAGPYYTASMSITAGPYVRGQLISTGGAATVSGAETAVVGILAEDANGTGTPVTCAVYTAGVYNDNKIVYGTAVKATVVADLRAKGIHIQVAQGA